MNSMTVSRVLFFQRPKTCLFRGSRGFYNYKNFNFGGISVETMPHSLILDFGFLGSVIKSGIENLKFFQNSRGFHIVIFPSYFIQSFFHAVNLFLML